MAKIKLYDVEFGSEFSYTKADKLIDLSELNFKWSKSSTYPKHKYNPSTDAEREEQAELKAEWENLSLDEAVAQYPDKVEIDWNNRRHILTEAQFEKLYKYCKLNSIIYPEPSSEIDIEDLANRIVSKLAERL